MKITPVARRRSIIALAVLAVFTLTGFFVLPPIVKAQLEQRLSKELGRRVTVGKVRLNPYALSLTLENFAIQERDGSSLFLGWRRFYANFDALSSLGGDWVLSEVVLDGFEAHGRINPDHSFNISDLLTKFTPPATGPAVKTPSAPMRPVRVGQFHVTDARIDIVDQSRSQPFSTTLGPVSFDLTAFRTVSERGAPYRFTAVTESGEKFAWTGTLRAEPFQSVGELSVENVVLAKYAPYYAERMQGDVVDGRVSLKGRYSIDLAEGHRVLTLQDGSVKLIGLKLRERGTDQIAVDLPSLEVSGIQADALTQKASVAAINLGGGHLRVRRENDGRINLLTMMQPPASTTAPASPMTSSPSAAPAKLPELTIGELALKDFIVELTDLASPRPAQLALNAVQFSLKNISLADGAQMPLTLALAWAPQGTVRVEGNVGLQPMKADLKIDIAGLGILPLSPYLEQFANVRITQGTVTTTLATQVTLTGGQPLAATVAGDVTVDKFGLVDAAHNEELAGFGGFTLRGLRATTIPELSVAIDEVNVAGPYARVVVGQDKVLNLATLIRTDPAPAVASASVTADAPVAANAAATPPYPKIEIGKVVIADGDYRFTDRSLEPNVSMAISQFGGTVTGLSSTSPGKGQVELKALVDGAGPVIIAGKLDPLGATKLVDLKVDLKNVDLQPLSPYSGKFAGYELARGKLTLDVNLKVEGAKIDAANVLTLNQFTFGQPVQSPDATGLPVRLGVALLKDMDGKIVIDVPVQGSTDDPDFRIGRVVLRVIVNLLTKAAVSPFSLLGAAFGGGGDELAFQEFVPGTAELQATEIKKLDTMVQALTNRPALSVGLEGSYDSAADAYAIKRTKVADQVRRTVWETKRLADPNIPPPEALTITPEENAATITKLFNEKFPPGTEFGAPLPQAPAVVTPPPPPPAGFFKRVVRAITLKGKREERAARQENARHAAEHAQAVDAAISTGVPVEEMSGRLAEATPVDDNELRSLAQSRALRVRDYFIVTGKIAADRLFLSTGNQSAGGDAAKAGKGPRVFLQLQ